MTSYGLLPRWERLPVTARGRARSLYRR